MPVSPDAVAVVRDWIQKAENDLTTATHTLKLRKRCPTDTVCFHAQQCVEKYLKAMLTLSGIDFPRTHDLGVLILRCSKAMRPDLSPEELDRMTEYATTSRYPGDYEPISLAEARRTVSAARRARQELRRQMPRIVLRPGPTGVSPE